MIGSIGQQVVGYETAAKTVAERTLGKLGRVDPSLTGELTQILPH